MEAETDIKPRDTVAIISGGPVMTVTKVGKAGITEELSAWCTWFDGKKPMEDVFPVTALRKAMSGVRRPLNVSF